MTNATPVEVTEADRRAAIELAAILCGNGHSLPRILKDAPRHFVLDAFARHRIEAARPVQSELVEALRVFRSFGCPVCNGDCSGANAPVMTCPMQMSWKALAALKETDKP
jgi:hypothetical protein